MLAPMVKAAGYDVVVAETRDEAIAKLTGGKFDVVLADADSLDHAEDIRRMTEDAAGASVIALSSKHDMRAMAMGSIVPKSDRGALLAALDEAIRARGEAA